MKIKYLMVLNLLLLPFVSVKSQSYEKGDHNFSFGYGAPTLNSLAFSIYKNFDNYKVTGFGAYHAKYGFAASDNIEIGINANLSNNVMSYNQTLWNVTDVNSLNYTSLDINARVNLHFGNSAEFDPYIGIGLGYNSTSATWSSTDANFIETKVSGFIPLGAEFTLGARYYFSQHVGIYGEVGFAQSLAQAGIVFQLY